MEKEYNGFYKGKMRQKSQKRDFSKIFMEKKGKCRPDEPNPEGRFSAYILEIVCTCSK
jgi:hypothetical protein